MAVESSYVRSTFPCFADAQLISAVVSGSHDICLHGDAMRASGGFRGRVHGTGMVV